MYFGTEDGTWLEVFLVTAFGVLFGSRKDLSDSATVFFMAGRTGEVEYILEEVTGLDEDDVIVGGAGAEDDLIVLGEE